MKVSRSFERVIWGLSGLLSTILVLLLGGPLVALLASVDIASVTDAVQHPLFLPAVWLSFKTSAFSLVIILLTGTPLAWWLSRSQSGVRRYVSVVVDLPIVVPPAVVGLALLVLLGRRGLVGAHLDTFDLHLAFTSRAVILAQVVVAAPFFVRTATGVFRMVGEDTLLVAKTLGARRLDILTKVVLPSTLTGLSAGASLAWARALGEFGATLIFAGSLPSETQTMPLAILTALELDVRLAVVFALALTIISIFSLLTIRRLASGQEVSI